MIRYNRPVTRVRRTEAGEERIDLKVLIDSKKVFLPVDADVKDGDLIEEPRPGGRTRTLVLRNVVALQSPFGSNQIDHTEADWKAATEPHPRQPIVERRLSLDGMHESVSVAAGALFADGHYTSAVFDAFKAVEERVKRVSGLAQSGKKLMGHVFGGATPKLDVTTTTGQNAADEREGFAQVFMGATQGIRNPRGHGTPPVDTAEETLEYLAVASMLMRRLDLAERRLRDQATAT